MLKHTVQSAFFVLWLCCLFCFIAIALISVLIFNAVGVFFESRKTDKKVQPEASGRLYAFRFIQDKDDRAP
jgi:hypothetical protein